jgi:hypothetical protein
VRIIGGALCIGAIYLAGLGAPFDFTDDGNLVYPAPPLPVVERLQLAWSKVLSNYHALGPFRPALWAHWEIQAELFRGNPLAWRSTRLAWTILSATLLLWCMHELRLPVWAAVPAVAVAFWNPYRNEIWMSLTLSEGVAMPYAIAGLICAVRAGRADCPVGWDLLGAACICVALLCKNTMAALVPAQLLLRAAPHGEPLGTALRARAVRLAALASPLLIPAGHFLWFQANHRPGQYEIEWSLRQLEKMFWCVAGAASLRDMMLPAMLLALAGIGWRAAGRCSGIARVWCAPWTAPAVVWARYPVACRAGTALLLCGVAVYLPIPAAAGRYSMPAVWGVDLWLAGILATAAAPHRPAWNRLVFALVVMGLGGCALLNLARQDRWHARNENLWAMLYAVESQAPPGAVVAWQIGPSLSESHGVHFTWHIQARGRHDLCFVYEGSRGLAAQGNGKPPEPPALLIGGIEPAPAGWQLRQQFRTTYRLGSRHYICRLYERAPSHVAAEFAQPRG